MAHKLNRAPKGTGHCLSLSAQLPASVNVAIFRPASVYMEEQVQAKNKPLSRTQACSTTLARPPTGKAAALKEQP